MYPLFAWIPGPFEMISLAVIVVLLFGRRLPDMGRSLGKAMAEFRKGMKGLDGDMDGGFSPPSGPSPKPRDDLDGGKSPPADPSPQPSPAGPKYPNRPLSGQANLG
jgi:sec-independent protein translocase protein TatA